MVPKSRMRRRAFLAAGAAATAGCGAVPPGALPGGLADANTRWLSVPEVEPRVDVSADHVAAARDHLRAVRDDAKAAWRRVDASRLPHHDRLTLRDGVEKASDALADTADAPGSLQTLETVQYGVGEAAETLGGARWLLGEYDPRTVESDARDVRRGVRALRERVTYEGDDPGRALVWLRQVEYNARQASMLLPTDDAGVADADSPALAAGAARSQVESSRRDLQDGRWFHARYRRGLSASTRMADRFAAAYDRLAGVASVRESQALEILEGGVALSGTVEAVVEQLYARGGSLGRQAREDAARLHDEAYVAYATVTAAEAVQRYRAERFALNAVSLPTDADSVGAARVSRAKRDAVEAMRVALEAHGTDPLVRRFLDAARRTVAAGDRALGGSVERSRAEAYARYLLGAGLATHAPVTARDATGAA